MGKLSHINKSFTNDGREHTTQAVQVALYVPAAEIILLITSYKKVHINS